MSAPVTATVRMYRLHELGDCFLVTFRSGAHQSRMLVDCGSFRNGTASQKRLQAIVDHIKADGAPLDVVVGTHQHNDHVSGFVHCEATFREIGVEQVWLSWLDDPRDRKAQSIGADFNNLKSRLAAVSRHAAAALRERGTSRIRAARAFRVLDEMLGFSGGKAAATPPEVHAAGVAVLEAIGRQKPLYLRPGRIVDLPGLPDETVRVHVLGPPRVDDDLLFRKNPRRGESYDHALASSAMMAGHVLNALERAAGGSAAVGHNYPFGEAYKRQPTTGSPALRKLSASYASRTRAWRSIDDAWLQQVERLALFLDTFTNNSSLVLAIELVKSGKVLLFAADAQTGNWTSWDTVSWERPGVTTDDLLARTVFYKVGHHASHNATLVQMFEKMISPDLIALVPVHKQDPNIKKENGWKMPAPKLFERIQAKTENRVLQMDGVNPVACDPKKAPAKAAWTRVGITPKTTPMAIEVTIEG